MNIHQDCKPSAAMPRGAHVVKNYRKNGSAKVFCYAFRGGPRLRGDPGTDEFWKSWDEYINRDRRRLEANRVHVCRKLIPVYQKRAQFKGLEFLLTPEWFVEKLKACGDACEVTGIAFDYTETRADRPHFKMPLKPSLDRIDNTKGYTPDNVRVVLHCVNVAINEWGLDHFKMICQAVSERTTNAD